MQIPAAMRITVSFFVIALFGSPLPGQEWGEKMFDKHEIKFGSVARLADTTFRLTVKNPYLEEIRITSLTTSCGCISWSDPLPISIPSRGERELTIRLDTVRHSGDKRVKAFVVLSEPLKGITSTVTIPVEGRIRNDFEVRPSSVAFGAIDLGRGYTQRISVVYTGQHDWKITSAKVVSPYLATKIIEQRRDGGVVQYEIVVELKPNAPAGVLHDQLVLATNEGTNQDVSIPIEARVEPDIVVTDAQFGAVPPGRPKSVTVILRGKKPFQIDKVEHATRVVAAGALAAASIIPSDSQSSAATDAFKFEFATNIAPVHTLTLTFTPPADAGMFDESFSVAISGRTQPVTFQARGRVLDQAASNASR
jgi:hypothetical protein